MSRVRAFVGLSVGVLVGISCGDSTTQPPPDPVPTTINLSETSLTLDALTATANVTATVLDQDGDPMSGQAVTWASNDSDVATVNGSGVVTATGNGSATITATAGDAVGEASVTVAQVVTQLAKIGGDEQTGEAGALLSEVLTVELRDAEDQPVAGGAAGAVANSSVNFTVTAGGGSVGSATATVDANGQAATTWTVGTTAGEPQGVSAQTAGGGASTSFAATVVAAAADSVEVVAGDQQTGGEGTQLPDSLVVRVLDVFGNRVGGHDVVWSVTGGGGSVNPATSQTDASGEAFTFWTVGAAGAQTAEADAGAGITGSPVEFTATAIQLVINAVSPDTLVEGQAATIDGNGFDPDPANNTVLVDGVAATITSASITQLMITVPAFDCRPARDVGVQVVVGGTGSNTVTTPAEPAAFVNLAVGEQAVITDPAGFCLQFERSGSSEAYLVGTQSLSETPSNLTTTRVLADTGQPAPAPPAMLALPARAVAASWTPVPSLVRRMAHAPAELAVRRADSMVLRALPRTAALGYAANGSTGTLLAQLVDSTVSVGDTLSDIRVWDTASNCTGFDALTTVVRAKGVRGIWLEDVANPASGYSQADFDSLSSYLDNVIFDTDTSFFGAPGDLDTNARIVILVTKEVNELSPGLLGFVASCDFFSRNSAPASNEGEFFYAKAPDPTGTFGSTYSRDDAFADAPFLIAHEFTHIIQLGRQIPAGAEFTTWLLEGQATLAEEVVGHAVEGDMAGQNYGHATAFNTGGGADIAWYENGFIDLARYFGLSASNTKIADAPHECTWIGRQDEGNDGPCVTSRAVYGTPWSLLRWSSDHFGSSFGGGIPEYQKALIDETTGGLQRLENVLGRSVDSLLAQWAASLYVDDRVAGADALLTHPSWDLFDVFETNSPAEWRLTPIEVVFGAIDEQIAVRAGSSGYFRLSGTSRPATAVRVRTGTDTTLPSTMQVWIVRLQ